MYILEISVESNMDQRYEGNMDQAYVMNSSTEDMIQAETKNAAPIDPYVQAFCRLFIVVLFLLVVFGVIVRKFHFLFT